MAFRRVAPRPARVSGVADTAGNAAGSMAVGETEGIVSVCSSPRNAVNSGRIVEEK